MSQAFCEIRAKIWIIAFFVGYYISPKIWEDHYALEFREISHNEYLFLSPLHIRGRRACLTLSWRGYGLFWCSTFKTTVESVPEDGSESDSDLTEITEESLKVSGVGYYTKI